MALLLSGMIIAGALAATPPAGAAASDPPQAPPPVARWTEEITARAHLIYKPDGARSPIQGDVVVIDETRRASPTPIGFLVYPRCHADTDLDARARSRCAFDPVITDD